MQQKKNDAAFITATEGDLRDLQVIELRSLAAEIRAMRPSTDANRLTLSQKHRENEIERLAYRRALNDVLDRIATRVTPPGVGRK